MIPISTLTIIFGHSIWNTWRRSRIFSISSHGTSAGSQSPTRLPSFSTSFPVFDRHSPMHRPMSQTKKLKFLGRPTWSTSTAAVAPAATMASEHGDPDSNISSHLHIVVVVHREPGGGHILLAHLWPGF